MNKIKRISAAALAAALMAGTAVTANAEDTDKPQYDENGLFIQDGVLYEASKDVKSVVIPDSVTEISYGAFSGCTSLTSVTIPNSVTYIDSEAFAGCTSLTSVNLPNSLTGMGGWVFYGCTSLTSINVEKGNQPYYFEDGFLLVKLDDGNVLLETCVAGKNGVATIPEGVTQIGTGAFGGCANLTGVTIPNSVIEIGMNAFSGCTGITSITIPNSETSFNVNVFDDSLKTIYGVKGSYAEEYAERFGHEFKEISDTNNNGNTTSEPTSEPTSTPTSEPTSTPDNSDTGVAGIAAAFGVIALAAGTVIVAKKKK